MSYSGGLTPLSSVEPVDVEWLWEPYIPLGKLTIIEGDPGLTKSWMALKVASSLSNGTALPGAAPKPTVTTLLLSAEDGLADTLRPRADVLGADTTRLIVLDEVLTLNEDGLARLGEAIIETGAKLVIIDPLVAFLGGKLDMHRANETRALLAPLAALAERLGVAIVLIRHLTKGTAKAAYRGIGSIDFVAAARSVLLIAADPDRPEFGRVLAHTKSNLAPLGESLTYELRPGHGFAWTGTSELTADELLAMPAVKPIEVAKRFLKMVLANGPTPVRDVRALAAEEGLSWRTLQRAQKALGVETSKDGFDGGWLWTLQLTPGPPKDATSLRV